MGKDKRQNGWKGDAIMTYILTEQEKRELNIACDENRCNPLGMTIEELEVSLASDKTELERRIRRGDITQEYHDAAQKHIRYATGKLY